MLATALLALAIGQAAPAAPFGRMPGPTVTFKVAIPAGLPGAGAGSAGIPEPRIRAAMRTAGLLWGHASGLAIREARAGEPVNITVVSRYLDGPWREAARATFPVGGRSTIVLDAGESWDDGRLRRVAAHELGHSLGVAHGPPGSAMAPVVNDAAPRLTDWDYRAARAIYSVGSPRAAARGR